MKKIPFSSSHHSVIEEDVNIYTAPPVLNRNTWEGRFLYKFQPVPVTNCPFASPQIFAPMLLHDISINKTSS